MFYIKSLDFNGIRSFPRISTTGNTNSQKIVFDIIENKITILQGNNGTGKTTILEVLKFALTGSYPFSPDKLTSFIRDPLADDGPHQVKQDSKGMIQVCFVQKHDSTEPDDEWRIKWEMKRTQGSEHCTEPHCEIIKNNGAWRFRGKRIQGVEKIATEIFRVSPAVWENVIMVPQEDTLWSFSKPGTLKDIFDRFLKIEDNNRELEFLFKRTKDLSQDIDKLGPELKAAQEKDAECRNTMTELENKKVKKAQIDQRIEQLAQEIDPLNQRIKDMKDGKHLLEEIQKYQSLIQFSEFSEGEIQNLDWKDVHQELEDCKTGFKRTSTEITRLEQSKCDLLENRDKERRKLDGLNRELGECTSEDIRRTKASEKIIELLKSVDPDLDTTDLDHATQSINSKLEDSQLECQEMDQRNQTMKDELIKQMKITEQIRVTTDSDFVKIPKDKLNTIKDRLDKENQISEEAKTRLGVTEGLGFYGKMKEIDEKRRELISTKTKLKVLTELRQLAQLESTCPVCGSKEVVNTCLDKQISQCEHALAGVPSLEQLDNDYFKLLDLLVKERVFNKLRPLLSYMEDPLNPTFNGSQSELASSDLTLADLKAQLSESQSIVQGIQSRNHTGSQLDESGSPPKRMRVDTGNDPYKKSVILEVTQKQLAELRETAEGTSRTGDCLNRKSECEAELSRTLSSIANNENEIKRLQESGLKQSENKKRLENLVQGRENYEYIQQVRNKLNTEPFMRFTNLEETKIELTRAEILFNDRMVQKRSLEDKLTKLNAEMAMIQRELNGRLRTAQRDYQSVSATYADKSNEKIKACRNAEVKRTEIMAEHQTGLRTMNRSFDQRWAALYSHPEVISSIELVASVKKGGKKRVDYNYHFNMILPNGKTLKMRGRSSLGEKYLASIIIRLALADVLCPDIPIFGFDAPAENLDEGVANRLVGLFKSLSEGESPKQLILTSLTPQFTQSFYQNGLIAKTHILEKSNGVSSIVEQ